MRIHSQAGLENAGRAGLESLYPNRMKVMVGMSSCGLAAGAQDVYDAVVKSAAAHKLDAVVCRNGCIGYCEEEPLLDLLSELQAARNPGPRASAAVAAVQPQR